MGRRTTRVLTAMMASAALVTCAACSTTVDGHGTTLSARDSASAPTPTSSTATPNSSAGAPTGAGAAAGPNVRGLVALLVPRPFGSVSSGGAWAANTTPTVRQFVAFDYPAAARSIEVQFFEADGIRAIAHRTWIAGNDDLSDIVLMSFRTPAGALARYEHATQAKLAVPGVRSEQLTGFANADLTYATAKDSDGFFRSIVYVRKGAIVEEAFGFTKPRFKKTEVVTWARRQADRLP